MPHIKTDLDSWCQRLTAERSAMSLRLLQALAAELREAAVVILAELARRGEGVRRDRIRLETPGDFHAARLALASFSAGLDVGFPLDDAAQQEVVGIALAALHLLAEQRRAETPTERDAAAPAWLAELQEPPCQP